MIYFTKRNLEPGMSVLEMKGSMNAGPDCGKLEREVDGMIAAGDTRLIFDMAGVTHADSAAIGAVVRCLTKLKSAGGALRLAAAQPMILHSLKLTKVDTLIEMFPSIELAAAGFALPEAGAGQRG